MPSHEDQREARRLALGAVFEGDFGQHTATSILERRLSDEGTVDEAASLARQIVAAVVDRRDQIDAQIEHLAPRYPVLQLARIDRALLRSASEASRRDDVERIPSDAVRPRRGPALPTRDCRALGPRAPGRADR